MVSLLGTGMDLMMKMIVNEIVASSLIVLVLI